MRGWLWFGAAALALTVAAPAAQAQPRGSYLQSCGNVQVTGGRDPQISASCTDMRGRQQFTSLRYGGCIGDIGNNNGQLMCQGGRPGDPPGGTYNDRSAWNGAAQAPGGSYQASCRDVQAAGGQLTASCEDMRGNWQGTSLRYGGCVGDIGNNNGQLVCNGGRPGSQDQPGWNGGAGDSSGWNQGGQNQPGRPYGH